MMKVFQFKVVRLLDQLFGDLVPDFGEGIQIHIPDLLSHPVIVNGINASNHEGNRQGGTNEIFGFQGKRNPLDLFRQCLDALLFLIDSILGQP